MRSWSFFAVMNLVWLSATNAMAEEGASTTSVRGRVEDARPTTESTDAERRAEAAYDGALRAYSSGDKRRALALMSKAYSLAPHSELLFNMARLERELGDCKGALATYRRYVAAATDEPSQVEAARAVRELDARCGESPPRSYWTLARTVGWSAVGAAAAMGAVAAYFAVESDSKSHDAEQLARGETQGPWDGPGPSLVAAAHHDAVAAGILSGAAAAFAGAGVVLLVFGDRRRAPDDVAVTVHASPDGAIAAFTHLF